MEEPLRTCSSRARCAAAHDAATARLTRDAFPHVRLQRRAGAVWRSDAALDVLGRGLGLALRVGRLALSGHAPAGHSFRLRPRALWRVDAAAVASDGRDLGEMTRLGEPVALRDFTIPQGPLFAVGASAFGMAQAGSNGDHSS